MVRTTLGRRLLASRPGRIVAAHPRAVTALVLSLVLLAMGGTAAASESFAGTYGEGVTNTGP